MDSDAATEFGGADDNKVESRLIFGEIPAKSLEFEERAEISEIDIDMQGKGGSGPRVYVLVGGRGGGKEPGCCAFGPQG